MIFWSYWHQGVAQAPQLVRDSWASWRYFHPEVEHVILDQYSISDYLSLDSLYDVEKVQSLSLAAYADIIRLELLNQYGGIWLDSTLLCLVPLTKWLDMEKPFFAFSNPGKDRMISNWFLMGRPDSVIIKSWTEEARAYWQRRVWRRPYYWPHYRFGVCHQQSADFRQEWASCQKISADGPHFFDPFHIRMYEPAHEANVSFLKANQAPILKLTYKTVPKDHYPAGSLIEYAIKHHAELWTDS